VKMIKLLQLATVVMFVIIVVVGLVILFLMAEKMKEYKDLVGTIFPVFLTMVVPALIGSPLSDYMHAKAMKIANGKAAQQASIQAGSQQGLVG